MDYDFFFKIVLIGDSGTGKSEMLLRYTGKRLNKESCAIAANFETKTVRMNGKIVKTQIWDLSGKKEHRDKTKGFCRFAEGAMIVYSIIDYSTFKNAEKWLKEIQECHAHPNIRIMLVGTHLNMSHCRTVTSKEAKEFADVKNLQFAEISANDSTSVEATFLSLITDIHQTFSQSVNFIESESETSSQTSNVAIERNRSFSYSFRQWRRRRSKRDEQALHMHDQNKSVLKRISDPYGSYALQMKEEAEAKSKNDDQNKQQGINALQEHLHSTDSTLATNSEQLMKIKSQPDSEENVQNEDTFQNEKQKLEEENKQLTEKLENQHQHQQKLEQHIVYLNNKVKSLMVNQISVLGRLTADESWKLSHKDIVLTKEELGRGGWGVIWIGQFREQRVAVKQMHGIITSQVNLDLLHREISTMAQLHHPNLLQFIGAVLDHPLGNPMIITEIMDMSLRKAYEDKLLTPSQQSECVSIMRDVACGLNYLHCLPDPIIHRDVSSANVLLENKGKGRWKTKISDFGSANKAKQAITGGVGAVVYCAPEAVLTVASIGKKSQTTKMDVFSYGVLLCEVLNCKFPSVDSFQELLQQIKVKSTLLYNLIGACVEEFPNSRPTLEQVIKQLDSHYSACMFVNSSTDPN